MFYLWLVSTLYFADKSRQAAVLLSFVSLINDADTEHTQSMLSDYSRQLLLSDIPEKHKKVHVYVKKSIVLKFTLNEMGPISYVILVQWCVSVHLIAYTVLDYVDYFNTIYFQV